MSLDEFQQEIRRGLRVAKLLEAEIEPQIAVQEADVEAFYQKNIERFQQGERSLAEIRTTIREFLAEQQREEKTDEFVVQLRARAKIEIYV
jgi:hypothetical protein